MLLCPEGPLDRLGTTLGSILEFFWSHFELVFFVFQWFCGCFNFLKGALGLCVSTAWLCFLSKMWKRTKKGKGKKEKKEMLVPFSLSSLLAVFSSPFFPSCVVMMVAVMIITRASAQMDDFSDISRPLSVKKTTSRQLSTRSFVPVLNAHCVWGYCEIVITSRHPAENSWRTVQTMLGWLLRAGFWKVWAARGRRFRLTILI